MAYLPQRVGSRIDRACMAATRRLVDLALAFDGQPTAAERLDQARARMRARRDEILASTRHLRPR